MKNQLISAAGFADSIKKSVFLFKKLWKEHTTLLLHAPKTVDKTATALDIIAGLERDVVYVNTSNSLDAHAASLGSVANMSVYTPRYDSPDDETDYADLVIKGIEEIIDSTDIRTFVVDSVSRIAALSFGRNASPAYVMKRLVALQIRRKISLLVIAHDSTRSSDRALLALTDAELVPVVDEVGTAIRPEPVVEAVEHTDSESCLPTAAVAAVVRSHPRKNLTRRERRLLRRQKQNRKTTVPLR